MLSFLKRHLGFTIAVVTHIVTTVVWYATLPHLTRHSMYASWIGVVICGFIVGAFDGQPIVRRIFLLGAVTAISSGVIHLSAASLGAVVDFGTLDGAIFIVFISIPFNIGLALPGGLIGLYLRKWVG